MTGFTRGLPGKWGGGMSKFRVDGGITYKSQQTSVMLFVVSNTRSVRNLVPRVSHLTAPWGDLGAIEMRDEMRDPGNEVDPYASVYNGIFGGQSRNWDRRFHATSCPKKELHHGTQQRWTTKLEETINVSLSCKPKQK